MSSAGLRSSLFRILRVTVLVLVLIGGAVWLRHILTSLDSEQAVINAEIIQVRAPINGVIVIGDVRPGLQLKKGDPLFKIENERFGDRETVTQFNLLESQAETLRGEVASVRRDLDVAVAEQARAQRLYKAELIARVAKEIEDTRVITTKKLLDAKTDQLARAEVRAREMESQMKLQKESIVLMPDNGLVWSISGKNGEQVSPNTVVIEVINPAHIWVDAFFAERHAPGLKAGLPAVIRTLDSAAVWRGHLESVRAGVGRLAYDTTVAVPPPEMAKRQIAVRVEADWERPFDAGQFFGVGRSVAVSFSKAGTGRTVGDLLREKWDRAIKGRSEKTARQ